MADPFTVFGAVAGTVGLVTTIITSLVSTTDTLYKKYQDLRNIDALLIAYHIRLRRVNQSLDNYNTIWFNGRARLSKKTGQTRWGKRGYHTILVMLRNINIWNNEIDRVLHKSRDELVETLEYGERRPESDMKIRKFQAVLTQITSLSESATRLEKLVEVLDSFSRGEYWKRLAEQDDTKKPTNSDVRRRDLEDQHLKGITDALNRLYEEQAQDWRVILGYPNLEDILEKLQYEPACQVDFVRIHEGYYQRVTVDIEPEFSGVFSNVVQHPDDGDTLWLLLSRCDNRRPSPQEGLIFARVAESVATSILLIKSHWTESLCTKCIMVTDQTCTFRHTEDWTLTQTLQWEASNFSKFGMVLAQLGMGKLYKAPRDNDEDLRELLRNTQRRAGPRYCRALETCFDMGKMQHKCRAQYLWRALENVVKPIQERYAIVNEEYEDYTRRL